jgi:hypothetical protein
MAKGLAVHFGAKEHPVPGMPRRFANYGAAAGFLIVVVPATVERLLPGTATLLDRLPQWLCPLGFADMTSTPSWVVLLMGAIQNGLLYAVLGLVIGLAAVGVRRLASRRRGEAAKD